MTTQYKIFPVGYNSENIISVDAYIYRDQARNNDSEDYKIRTKWVIKPFISIYDFEGKLLSKNELKKSEIVNESYLTLLETVYKKGFEKINKEYPNLKLFTPEYISFCDFQKKCEKLELRSNIKSKNNYLIFQKRQYKINLDNYSVHENSALYSKDLSSYYLSSIRIYKAERFKLVVSHLETGHEISMGWITSDPNKKPKDDSNTVILAKEEKPNIKFENIENAVYKEPLLHHAYGFDFMLTNK